MSALQLIPAVRLADLPPTKHLGNTKFIERGFNIVFGASGAFKSFYVLDAALWISQTAPVVYVAAEGTGGLNRRIVAWSEYFQKPFDNLYFICQEVNLLQSAQVKDLINAIKPVAPIMTVFDTLARCIPGGDENTAKDMGIAINHSAAVQRQIDCAVTWIHHTNRAERGERGSGSMRGAADTMIELTANGDNVIRVICSKLKDEEPWPVEELQFQPIGDSGVLLPNDGQATAKLSSQELQILEFLSLEVFETSGARAAQIVNSLNISERHIYRMLSHLKHELTLTHDSKGDPYRLTDKGKTLIRHRSAKTSNVISLVKSAGSNPTDTTDIELTLDPVI
jgi:predicted transcriptional regulator